MKLLFLLLAASTAMSVSAMNFKSTDHPRVFVTEADRAAIIEKTHHYEWAHQIVEDLHRQIDPIVAIHKENPEYVISRMQMHWEEGKHYTRFYTDGNWIPRREGNAKYPTVRLTYGRAASNSTPMMPLDKIIPYGDGSLTKPAGTSIHLAKKHGNLNDVFFNLGSGMAVDTIPFDKTGLGTETINRGFMYLAWRSAILYYLTQNKDYAKLSADILWTLVRGAAQQEQVNPDEEGGYNGFLSFETLGDTRHFATLPVTYDMICDYLHDEFFDQPQFRDGLPGQRWAPAHPEGKAWALRQFEVFFKKEIENKLSRGGGLQGNWNINEQESAMLFALALDDDACYSDHRGRGYYVDKLVNGPTTERHGAYLDVVRANISPATGLWPEAPGGYGQGSIAQIVRFGYIYFRNGLDYLSSDALLNKAAGATRQMLFPNGYITNVGDASYSLMRTDAIEMMMAYYHEKGDETRVREFAELLQYAPSRDLGGEFFYPLFFYLGEVPSSQQAPSLPRCSASKVYANVIERNPSTSGQAKDALAFSIDGFTTQMGHRQPNALNIELYGRGHILAPDQGVGADYWSRDTHQYKINVAAHNTVTPNGKGADNDRAMPLAILHAEPAVVEGEAPTSTVSDHHQYVDVSTTFDTREVKADQRRTMAIVRTGEKSGYYLDIFRSIITSQADPEHDYHDYIYHNMGIGAEMLAADGTPLVMTDAPLDTLSGKGYGYFETLGAKHTDQGFGCRFDLGMDDVKMQMLMAGEKGRTIYHLNSPYCHRYYAPELRQTPIPAVLVRQSGEAWEQPFIALYEPYGNGAERLIRSLETETTQPQSGVVKVTVRYLESGRYDRIIHCTSDGVEAEYQGIRFKGTLCIAQYKHDCLVNIYVGDGRWVKTKGVNRKSKDGRPFDALIECAKQ